MNFDGVEVRVARIVEALGQVIDSTIERAAGERLGFALFIMPHRQGGSGHYVGNAERAALRRMVIELLDDQEAGGGGPLLHLQQAGN